MATTTHASLQASGSGVTRRSVIRWVGRVAVAGALTTHGVNSPTGSVDASRQLKRRNKQRRHDQQQVVSTRALDATLFPEDQSEGDLDFAGYRCRHRLVCTPSGWCTHRTICR